MDKDINKELLVIAAVSYLYLNQGREASMVSPLPWRKIIWRNPAWRWSLSPMISRKNHQSPPSTWRQMSNTME